MPDQLMTGMEFPSLCTVRMLTHAELDQWVDYGLLRVLRNDSEDEDEDEDDEDNAGDDYYMEPLDGYASCSVARSSIGEICGLAVETPNHPGFVYLVDYLGNPISLGLGCEPIPGALPAWLFTLEEDQQSQITAQLFIDHRDRVRSLLTSLARVYPVEEIDTFLQGSDLGRMLVGECQDTIARWMQAVRPDRDEQTREVRVEGEVLPPRPQAAQVEFVGPPVGPQAQRYTIQQALEDNEAMRLATRWVDTVRGMDLVRQEAALAEPYNTAAVPPLGSLWGADWSVVRDLNLNDDSPPNIDADRPLRVITENELERLVELNVVGHERELHRYYFGGQLFPEIQVLTYHFPREDYRFLRYDRETQMATISIQGGRYGVESDIPVWMLAYADCARIPEDQPTEVAGFCRGHLVQLRPPTELQQEMEQRPDATVERTIAWHYINYRGAILDLPAYRQLYDTGPHRLTRFANEQSVLLGRSTVPIPLWALVRGDEDQERRRHQVIPRQDIVVGQVVELLDVQELRDLANHPDFTVQEDRVVHEPEPHLVLDIAQYGRYTWRRGQFVVTNTFDDAVVNHAADEAVGTHQTMTMVRVRPIDGADQWEVPYWVLRAVEDTTTEQPQAEAEPHDPALRLRLQMRLGQTVRLLTRRQLCTRAGHFPDLRLLDGDRIVDESVGYTLVLSDHTFREQRGELLCVVERPDNYMVGVVTHGGSSDPVLLVPYWALDVEQVEDRPPLPARVMDDRHLSTPIQWLQRRIVPGARVWQLTRTQLTQRAERLDGLHLSTDGVVQDIDGLSSVRVTAYEGESGIFTVISVRGQWVKFVSSSGELGELPYWALQHVHVQPAPPVPVPVRRVVTPDGDTAEEDGVMDIPNLRKPSVVALTKLRQYASCLGDDPSEMTEEQRIHREKVVKLMGKLLPEMIDWVFIGMKSQE